MKIDDTALPGIKALTPNRFGDDRGHFSETWNKTLLTENGIDIDFIQDNQSVSVPTGTLRGLHFQAPPRAQDKLICYGELQIWTGFENRCFATCQATQRTLPNL